MKKERTKNDREAKKGAASKPVMQATFVKTETRNRTWRLPKERLGDQRQKRQQKHPPKAGQRQRQRTLKQAPPRHYRESSRLHAASEALHLKALAEAQALLPAPEPVKQPRTKQTAPQGNGSRWSQSRPTPRDPSPETPRFATLQTARRGGSFAARGRIPAPSGYDDAPPPYSEFPYQDYSSDENNGSDDVDEVSLAPLGLLNGDYEVESRDVSKQWDFDRDEFQLTLTIAGNRLWGRFNLGVYEGVLLIEERPMRSSHDRVWFKWRGREDQGPVIYGDRNEGWMEFLGDGLIEGWLDHQSLSFQARRLPGQGTRSSIDARTLQDEWNGYSYRLYEEENRARWR
ncbi:hypothetical protein H9Q70_000129 [Fusarium xylarioides]|nr:hypothetical protein H9Q70_000129 [Fusarium xylarioides]